MSHSSKQTNYRKVANLYKSMISELSEYAVEQNPDEVEISDNSNERSYNENQHVNIGNTSLNVTKRICEITDDSVLTGNIDLGVMENSESETNEYYSSDSSGSENNINIRDELKKWAINNNCTHTSVSELLKILNRAYPSENLPVDARSLLQTNTNYIIIERAGGHYYHFGIAQSLKLRAKIFANLTNNEILLSIGIDGLPLSKSSSKCFWPILGNCRLKNIDLVFTIGLYYGDSKPNSIQSFLQDFCEELELLESDGILIEGKRFYVRLHCLIADAPARAFVKACNSYISYFGCERCVVKGSYSGRVIFCSTQSRLRTNNAFKLQLDSSHHTLTSPLAKFSFGLISQVPIDYMHLICLGVMRKLLRSWVKNPKPIGIDNCKVKLINARMISIKGFVAKEFHRKPRSISEVDRWKATEFRSFLLYYGPVVLVDILPNDKYVHFMHLSIGTYILLSEKANDKNWNELAKGLLTNFVKSISRLYSKEWLVYNVHSLLHIADDALNFGPLDNISAFRFENFMQVLKHMLRGKNNYLSQAIRRLSEFGVDTKYVVKAHDCDITCNPGDCTVLCSDGSIVEIVNVTVTNYKKQYICKKYINRYTFFDEPISSSLMSIFKVNSSDLLGEFELNPAEIIRKCMCLPLLSVNDFVVIPLVANVINKKDKPYFDFIAYGIFL